MNILKILTERRMTGNFGEGEAAKLLKKKGYKILAKNHVEGDGEIDIIAADSEFTVFVEVKTRKYGVDNPVEPRAASSVTPEKQRRIIKAAKTYLAYNPTDKKVRFDVIEVYYDTEGAKRRVREINHLEGAFDLNTAKGHRK
ncbi:MAG: YraN family protein [Clostridia bacterium]|nr:YraN family protein [Clostridia bacterium]